MQKLIWIIVVLAALSLVGWVLHSNQQQMVAAAQQAPPGPISVQTAHVVITEQSDSLLIPGVFAAEHEVELAAEASGPIQLHVALGQSVQAGQLVASVPRQVASQQLAAATQRVMQLSLDLHRAQQLLTAGSVAKAEVEQLQASLADAQAAQSAAQEAIRTTQIISPIAGQVSSRAVQTGAYVQPGSPVATITNTARLRLRLFASQQAVHRLRTGQAVRLSSDVAPVAQLIGHIAFIGTKADASGSFPVEVALANQGQPPLRAGMTGKAHLPLAGQKAVLTMPRQALQRRNGQAFVYRVVGDRAVQAPITVGEIGNQTVQVLSGLSANDQVVIAGQQNLTDSARIRTTSSPISSK